MKLDDPSNGHLNIKISDSGFIKMDQSQEPSR